MSSGITYGVNEGFTARDDTGISGVLVDFYGKEGLTFGLFAEEFKEIRDKWERGEL